ncbi:hypothetical protein BHE74_00048591 [Ensete ventricosum]|nr:hypothetical protein GW17_00027035 [Ensete ventricosum]RWW45557.1 hypothetical protein BHE74_00048591 [Ensete ventricosum]RZS04574.1 hypothetical protein BHM03_00034928 [Ensete ventricosum]
MNVNVGNLKSVHHHSAIFSPFLYFKYDIKLICLNHHGCFAAVMQAIPTVRAAVRSTTSMRNPRSPRIKSEVKSIDTSIKNRSIRR